MLLEIEDLSIHFDTALVLNEVSLEVEEEELVGLVGPNGAGKTTLLRSITGLVRREREIKRGTRSGDITIEGKVKFGGKRIDNLPPHEIVEMGLIHCPERRRPFSELTVLENLKAGAHLHRGKIEENLKTVFELFPVLEERKNQVAGKLSGGEQQMLAIGRAMMSEPRLLCIDEPSLGLAPKVKNTVFNRIKEIKGEGITILLSEQDVSFAFSLSNRNYVLSHGKIVREGTGEELLADENIKETYLGL